MRTSMEEDVRRTGSRVEHAESQSAEYCQRRTVWECRANAESLANNGCFPERKLQLQFQTKLLDRVFTKDELPGKGSTIIRVALIDADTRHLVTSGRESSVKLKVVVLNDAFEKDEEDNWAPEEFEQYVVQGRKGPLLKGNLQVRMKEGVAELRGLSFNENSSKTRNGKFRIGVKLAPGYCGNTQIREGITNAVRVLERRGKEYQKPGAPALEDDVWRLKQIAKNGPRHQKLIKAGIYSVQDFLLQLSVDREKLKEILGMEKRYEDWKILEDHAKTCETNWQLYLYYAYGEGELGAIFDSNGCIIGLIKNRVYVATRLLSSQDKDFGLAIVNMALAHHNDVWVLNGKTFSGSMQQKSSSSSSCHVLDGFAPGTSATRVGQEAPPANAASAGEDDDFEAWLDGIFTTDDPPPDADTF